MESASQEQRPRVDGDDESGVDQDKQDAKHRAEAFVRAINTPID
jgi:hypothetical protein